MKKVIVGVFAHPDDESFGPAGTLILEHEQGTEIHLITLTAGESGANPDNVADLGSLRLEEWRKAGELIGATSMTHLGYKDGTLSNTSLVEITEQLEQLVRDKLDDDVSEVEFMSFELGGISGHIDHIVAARATCGVFYRMKPFDARFTRVRLFCITEECLSEPDVSWIFMDKGYPADECEHVDVTDLLEQRIKIIRTHVSQRGDGDNHIKRHYKTAAEGRQYDYFVIRD